MNSQQTSIKHSAAGRDEEKIEVNVDPNLKRITDDLQRCIEGRDKLLLDSVKHQLDVAQGVFTKGEQYGVAVLTEEMASLCESIAEQESAGKKQDDQALDVLLRAVLQLPDYLAHVQSGHRDIPFAILLLLNDIRSIKKHDLFSDKRLFLPDLSMHGDDAEIDAIDGHANDASKQLIKKLRPAFQLSLLNVIKDNEVDENFKCLEKIFDVLEESSSSEQVARVWWIIGALVESVSRHKLELGVSIKNLLGKVDTLFRVLLTTGERGLLKRQPIELIKNFLYYIAQPECDGPKCQAIKAAYRLEEFLPNEADRNQLRNNFSGPNQALCKIVLEVVSNNIKTVKAGLEIYANSDLNDVQKLQDIPYELHVISDTLAMIGLGEQRQIIEAQFITIKKIISNELKPSEGKMCAMVLELIQVEQVLEQKRQPKEEEAASLSKGKVARDLDVSFDKTVEIKIKAFDEVVLDEAHDLDVNFLSQEPSRIVEASQSINQAILVRAGDETYALPLINVEGIVQFKTHKLAEQYRQTKPALEHSGHTFRLHYLSTLVESSAEFTASADKQMQSVILSCSGDIRVALHVDRVIGKRDIIAKSLGKQLDQVKGLLGASILDDGNVVLILDINRLVKHGW
ncbi:MAG: hypothetical protein ACI8XX_000141 [Polaribacter sp.]|jgi:hypothetical protein